MLKLRLQFAHAMERDMKPVFFFANALGGVVLFAACALSACATPAPPPSAPTNVAPPILLVHGFSGYRDLPVVGGYFHAVAERLEHDGFRTFTPALPPYSPTELRAPYLAAAIDDALQQTGAKQVHLVAHSQGGIDARFVIQDLKMADKVATLTTISTPHRGSPVLDAVSYLPGFVSWPLFGTIGWAIDVAQGAQTGAVDVEGAFAAMHPRSMEAFNASHPTPAGIGTFSIAGVTGPDRAECTSGTWGAPRFWDAPDLRVVPTWMLIRGDPHHPRASDGVVPVDSAKWGTFLGCIPADHFDQMGNGAEIFASDEAMVLDHLAFFSAYARRLRAYEATHDPAVVSAPMVLPHR